MEKLSQQSFLTQIFLEDIISANTPSLETKVNATLI